MTKSPLGSASSPILSSNDRKTLNRALETGRAFEAALITNAESANSQSCETDFRAALAACAQADSSLLVKLAELAPKVSLALGHRHLMGLLVPIERLTGRAARDEEFLYEERDGRAAPDNTTDTSAVPNFASSRPRTILCENIRSAFNVGAIFRTAEAFSATSIYLCGYTPDPTKTAMGADALVETKRFDRTMDAIDHAKAEGFKIVALENAPGAMPLEDFTWPEKTLLILGNERFGVDSETLAACDHVVRIAATGQKNSINVGVAFGVAASRWRSRSTTAPAIVPPIGFLRGGFKNTQVAPRQGSYGAATATIELESRFEGRPSNFEQALQDLDGFERAWVIFGFHESQGWNPQVRPPRGDGSKRGLFATRSPHRPNGIGISCVRIERVIATKRIVEISEHDLLDGTPIFDIKPYVPGADSFSEARAGWVDAIEASAYKITETIEAKLALDWLDQNGESRLRPFIDEQLRYQPLDAERKRVAPTDYNESPSTAYTIAFRTWRIDFRISESMQTLALLRIRSGYAENEIAVEDDPYGDKKLHRTFKERKP